MDTNVVVSATFWPETVDRKCFVFVARRKCLLAASGAMLDEYCEVTTRVGKRCFAKKNPAPFLTWLQDVATIVEPSPLGKQRSRDAKDDPFLACAIASRAKFIVSKDHDLLVMKKPFGVEIITPTEFCRRLGEKL